MYRGFNLNVGNSDFNYYFDVGQGIYSGQKKTIKSKISSFKGADGALIASKMTADWFPEIEADVFLSHSHRDSPLAIAIVGFLKEKFGLVGFIDSGVWGYSVDLIKMIDNEFCYQADSETYNYSRRNRSTSHVHMMLSVAIARMMNRCECVFFVNTPATISQEDYIKETITDSPWIYSEIAMVHLLQKRSPLEHRRRAKRMEKADMALDEAFKVHYEIDLNPLVKLSLEDIKSWIVAYGKTTTGLSPLDVLYNMRPAKQGGV